MTEVILTAAGALIGLTLMWLWFRWKDGRRDAERGLTAGRWPIHRLDPDGCYVLMVRERLSPEMLRQVGESLGEVQRRLGFKHKFVVCVLDAEFTELPESCPYRGRDEH